MRKHYERFIHVDELYHKVLTNYVNYIYNPEFFSSASKYNLTMLRQRIDEVIGYTDKRLGEFKARAFREYFTELNNTMEVYLKERPYTSTRQSIFEKYAQEIIALCSDPDFETEVNNIDVDDPYAKYAKLYAFMGTRTLNAIDLLPKPQDNAPQETLEKLHVMLTHQPVASKSRFYAYCKENERGTISYQGFKPEEKSTSTDNVQVIDPLETRGAQTDRKTVGWVIKENIPEIFYYLVIGGLEIGFIIWLMYVLLPLALAIAPITLLSFAFIGMGVSEFRNRLNEKSEPKTKPDRDFLFLQTDRTLLKDLNIVDAHATVVQTINAVHNTDNRLLHNTDTFALTNAYDKYMDMLIFVLANKDKLSTRLIEKYTQSLHGKADAVLQEAAHVFNSIKTQEEFVHKATEESRRLQQEMIDSEAESIMPPD